MDDLTYTLRTLCLRNRDGSHATQADRLRALVLMSRQLREDGFRQMRATSLKGKHVDALIARWQAEGLSTGTLKNRVAHLRWWAEKVGKAGVIPADNAQLAFPTASSSPTRTRRVNSVTASTVFPILACAFAHVAKRFCAAAHIIARRGLRYGACQPCERASGAVEPVRPPAMVSDRHDLQYH